MTSVLITGISGVGKSSVLRMLAERGFTVLDTDEPGWTVWSDAAGGYIWDETRIRALLAHELDAPRFISGAVSNQGRFYEHFSAVALLSAPIEVLLERIARRETNTFGKTAAERSRIVQDHADVEPLMRRTCTVEIDATLPLERVVDLIARLAR